MLYPETWQAFIQLPTTQGAVRRNYPEWHLGRERYHVWALDIDNTLVSQRLQHCRDLLADFLVRPYKRQPHVTLAACGFINAFPVHNDDVSSSVIEKQMLDVKALNQQPFEIRIGGINSFASAPFLEVEDVTHALAKIRTALAGERGDFRTSPYVPHLTIGIYNGRHQVDNIVSQCVAADEPIPLVIKALVLYAYDASDIGAPLQEVWRLGLAS